jgi:DNA-binding NarL/FixJ family response regulator
MRALLVGETPLSLAGVVDLVHGYGAQSAVKTVPTAAMARTRMRDEPGWDLVFLDHQLPDGDAFQLMAELRAKQADLAVILVSTSVRKADVLSALDEGAVGFIPADLAREALADAIRLIAGGGVYVPPSILRAPGGRHEPSATILDPEWDGQWHDAPRRSAGPERSPASFGLTPRQTDVLFLLLQGQTNKQIARELKLSVETVKEHVAAVLRTLNVNSRAQAVLAVNPLHSDIWDWRARREAVGHKR